MPIITPQDLIDRNACSADVATFRKWCVEVGATGIAVTIDNLLLAEARGLRVEWLVAEGFVTREQACAFPSWACAYARHVDQGAHQDTRAAVTRDPVCARWYRSNIDNPPGRPKLDPKRPPKSFDDLYAAQAKATRRA